MSEPARRERKIDMDHRSANTELYNIPFLVKNFRGMPFRILGRSGLKISNIGLGKGKVILTEEYKGKIVELLKEQFDKTVI